MILSNRFRKFQHLFLIGTICFFECLLVPISTDCNASTRGIMIKAHTNAGDTHNIKLYSGYHALVVGCGDYRAGWPKLPNPVKDAREVALALKKIDCQVDLLEDPDWATLRRALNELITGPGRDPDKAILFWFSGHGHTLSEVGGRELGYIVPVDAPNPDRDEIGFMEKAISMRQIETYARRLRSNHALMLFDSCFSGAIFQAVRSKPSPYIEEKVKKPVRQFITAGGQNEQVPDVSVFKTVFVQSIEDGYADRNRDGFVTGMELGDYLQEQVVNYSRGSQHPQFGMINDPLLDKGDFILHISNLKKAEDNFFSGKLNESLKRKKSKSKISSQDNFNAILNFQSHVTKIIDKIFPSVVNIRENKSNLFNNFFNNNEKKRALGTGFIIDKNGFIITNHHVISEATNIEVNFDNRYYLAKVIDTNKSSDIALLKIDVNFDLPKAAFGKSDSLIEGEIVSALGCPFGLGKTVSLGSIMKTNTQSMMISNENLIVTNASINPGNSGGPLVNMKGQIIGMNVAFSNNQNLGYAIPSSIIIKMINRFIENTQKDYWPSLSEHKDMIIKEENLNQWFDQFFIADFKKSIVTILDQNGSTIGSGFFISKNGYILTNQHILKGVQSVSVLFENVKIPSVIVGKDETIDTAIIKIDSDYKIYELKIAINKSLRNGHFIASLPNLDGSGFRKNIGVISATGNIIGYGPYNDFIQTDIFVPSEITGSPLFNIKGEVVGISTAITSRSNIGFAVPIYSNYIDQLITNGKISRCWLGIEIQNLTTEKKEKLELSNSRGILITNVHKGTPADKIGVKSEDILLQIDGKDVYSTEMLIDFIRSKKAGEKARLLILRDDKTIEFMPNLVERPN